MSRQTIQRPIHCGNDCRQSGCPGHIIELEHHHTSDTVTVRLDAQHYATFDAKHWRALVNMEQELRDRDKRPCDHKFVDSTHCLKCGWDPRRNAIATKREAV